MVKKSRLRRHIIPWGELAKVDDLVPKCKLLDVWDCPISVIARQRDAVFHNVEGVNPRLGEELFIKTCKKCLYVVACYDEERRKKSNNQVQNVIQKLQKWGFLSPVTIRKRRRS